MRERNGGWGAGGERVDTGLVRVGPEQAGARPRCECDEGWEEARRRRKRNAFRFRTTEPILLFR